MMKTSTVKCIIRVRYIWGELFLGMRSLLKEVVTVRGFTLFHFGVK